MSYCEGQEQKDGEVQKKNRGARGFDGGLHTRQSHSALFPRHGHPRHAPALHVTNAPGDIHTIGKSLGSVSRKPFRHQQAELAVEPKALLCSLIHIQCAPHLLDISATTPSVLRRVARSHLTLPIRTPIAQCPMPNAFGTSNHAHPLSLVSSRTKSNASFLVISNSLPSLRALRPEMPFRNWRARSARDQGFTHRIS